MTTKTETVEYIISDPEYRRLFETALALETYLVVQNPDVRPSVASDLESIYQLLKRREAAQTIQAALDKVVGALGGQQ